MARLRRQSPVGCDSGDEFAPEVASRAPNAPLRKSPRKKALKQYNEQEIPEATRPVLAAPLEERQKQIRLAPLKSLESSSELRLRASPEKLKRRPVMDAKMSAARSVEQSPKKLEAVAIALDEAPAPEPEEEADFEESIWCGSEAGSGSDSDEDLPSPRKLWPTRKQSSSDANQRKDSPPSLVRTLESLRDLRLAVEPEERTKPRPLYKAQTSSRPSSSGSDKENYKAILRFSPPRLREERAVTPPPNSPSKSKLVSPSKTRTKIPTPPLRQSLDAFWNADTVNDWNDQYSPQKIIKSPKKNRLLNVDASPTSSPKKTSQSPTKAERQAKKDFASSKQHLATTFLAELDDRITSGQIATLSASTGGVQIIWSKTLNSTAGRANWRRETIKTRQLDGTVTVAHKHHASIELAEKVIDDSTRLIDVLAHEFCHLANFMISGIKDQPHGASFKAWGRKVTAEFAGRGVEVTTKHSYQIDYKYVWQCVGEECGAEFKRHSKSIDPRRHTCGSCRGRLLQVKPVPRGGGGGAKGEVGGYAGFVKKHFADVKRSLPAGASQKEVMEAVGARYRAEKEAKAAASGTKGAEAGKVDDGLDAITGALEVVVLDD